LESGGFSRIDNAQYFILIVTGNRWPNTGGLRFRYLRELRQLRASARAGQFVATEQREIIKIVVSMRDGRHNTIA
jgi:hypothetical protein